MRYVHYTEDEKGDVVDVAIYCSATCWQDASLGDPSGHYIPAPEPADYDQHCPTCERVVVVGNDNPQPSFDGWPV